MSEADSQVTSILLPEAKVAVYSKDKKTLKSAEKTQEDWRFARVKIAPEEGDVETAIAFYEDQPSPDLIIIQTDEIDDSLTENLEKLAGNCDEGTAAIVVGPVNDVYLYRQLIEMGVSDYLVKPIPPEVMSEVIAKTLIERLGVSDSRLIAFVGAKGGVGVSALAQGAASGMSGILGQKTILLDGSGGWSTASVGFDFEPSATLAEAANAASSDDGDSLDRMIVKADENLSILASGSDIMLENPIDPDGLETLLDKLLVKYPIMVADLSHASPELSKIVISRANQIVVVSTPFLPSLRLARSLIGEIKEVRGGEGDEIDFIINMQGLDRADEVPAKDIEAAIEMEVSKTIAFASNVFLKAESSGKTLLSEKEGRKIIEESLLPIIGGSLLDNLSGNQGDEDSGLFDGLLNKLKSK